MHAPLLEAPPLRARGRSDTLAGVPENPLRPRAVASATTRWDLVARAQTEELRRMTATEKLERVAALMASVKAMGWDDALQEGDLEIWMRWQRVREHARRRARKPRAT